MFVNRGALVLEPNYRGGSGYGEKFRKLNIRNLGIGDAWDVMSGVDSLVAAGHGGCAIGSAAMGLEPWRLHLRVPRHRLRDRLKAVSVGAGVTDWTTYYSNTDIELFTRRYLKATPWTNLDLRKASPITYV